MKILLAAQDQEIENLAKEFLQNHRFSGEVEVVVFHVVDSPPYGYYANLDARKHVLSGAERSINTLVDDLKQAIPAIFFRGVVVEGDPKVEIVRYAESLPADLILIGSHGRGALGRFFLGSVSLAVHTEASCSLFILRQPKQSSVERVAKQSQQAVVNIPTHL